MASLLVKTAHFVSRRCLSSSAIVRAAIPSSTKRSSSSSSSSTSSASSSPPPASSNRVVLPAFHSTPDYASFLSELSANRQPSAIRSLQKYMSDPGMISLGGGMPNPRGFPISALSFQLQCGHVIRLTPGELAIALQYSATEGLTRLVSWINELQQAEHQPPRPIKVCVTNGSQEALTRAFDMLLSKGDSMLIESPTYSGTLAALVPMGLNLVTVATDNNGLVPQDLANTLASWPSNKPKPRVLYTIPTAGNPTGATQTLERKKAVYAIAQQHNLLILEDDPYYYLQFSPSRVPSLQSLDVDGRVLRFDSFSKVMSSGMRLGFVSGPEELISRIVLHGQVTTLHASGVGQMIATRILEHWGLPGFYTQVRAVCDLYKHQCEAFLASADKHLTGLAEWNRNISGGMFAWLRLVNIPNSQKLITERAVKEKVLFVPGMAFYPPTCGPSSYVRASFSISTPAGMDEALSRLARLLREPEK